MDFIQDRPGILVSAVAVDDHAKSNMGGNSTTDSSLERGIAASSDIKESNADITSSISSGSTGAMPEREIRSTLQTWAIILSVASATGVNSILSGLMTIVLPEADADFHFGPKLLLW